MVFHDVVLWAYVPLCFTCSNILLYTNVITHSRCVFCVWAECHFVSSESAYDEFHVGQENVLIDVISVHEVLYHMLQFHE